MDRRNYMKNALLSVAGTAAACAPAERPGPKAEGSPAGAPAVFTGKRVQWRLASSFPRSLDIFFESVEVLAQRVAAMSEGGFEIRVYPAGELVPGLQVMDAVQQGTVQIAQTASYYFTGKNPALAFEAGVPFGLTARQQLAWLNAGGGLELCRELFADFGIISFPAGSTGAQMGGWFRREIGSVADLHGLKMRIPGLGGEVMSRLGVTVQVLAGGDIFPALERGALDATEWVGPYDDLKLGFHQVAKYYYYPGWWEPGPTLSYLVNRAAWDQLPKVYQEIFTTAASESASTMLARYDQRNPPALAQLLAQGVEVRPFADDMLRAAANISRELLEEQAQADAAYNKVYTAWKKARQEAYHWFATAELAYARFAFLETV